MFKKIVSQISFSPATVERLSDYATKTRNQQRLMGGAAAALWCLVVIGALVHIFTPHTTASPTANDLISGGATSVSVALSAYDNNVGDFRLAANLLSIERSHLEQAQPCQHDESLRYVTGKTPYLSEPLERIFQLPNSSILYMRQNTPVKTAISGWCGTSAEQQPFMLSAVDGNIYTAALPVRAPLQTSFTYAHSAHSSTADPLSTSWELSVTNNQPNTYSEDVIFAVGDISEYAQISSVSDEGIVSESAQQILWPGVQLEPGEQITLVATARANQPADETAQQAHNPNAYDCRLSTVFGNTVDIAVPCPLTKQAEMLFHRLPASGSIANLVLYSAVALLATILYLSLKLHSKELRIIRRQINSGGL